MALGYYIMRKNDIITYAEFTEDGIMTSYSSNFRDMEIAPLAHRCLKEQWLRKWWRERAVPVTRDQINDFLKKSGYSGPEEYLINNLGLSLTDYYWIKPIDSDLTWEKVNLFDNDFHADIFLPERECEEDDIPRYSPNSSLQGDIEKTWTIINNERSLIKGNHTKYSSESINEVIASRIHKDQKYDNYLNYELLKIKGKSYDYGCVSKMFTSQELELVPAWAVCTSEKRENDVSYFEHFLNVCVKHGMDLDRLKADLDYLILTDFILSGYDRHLNNIAVLRNAETLRFERLAPIFDSGGSMFVNRPYPKSIRELENFATTGFASRESKMLKLVTDPSVIDLSLLPAGDYIREMYHKDSQIDDNTVEKTVIWYEKKIELCRRFQMGKNVYHT